MIRRKPWNRSAALAGVLLLGSSTYVGAADERAPDELEILKAPLSRDDPRSRLDPALADVPEEVAPAASARSRRAIGTPATIFRYRDPETGKTTTVTERALRRVPRGSLGAAAPSTSEEEVSFEGATGAVPPDAMAAGPDAADLGGIRQIFGTDGRGRVTPTTTYPARTRSKVIIHWKDGSQGGCSGTLIGPRHVLTNAHCLYNKGKGGVAPRVEVIPGLDGTYMPYGSVNGSPVLIGDADDPKHDYGVIRLHSEIGRSTGWLGIRVFSDSTLEKASATVAGYPGDMGGTFQYSETGTLSHVDSALLKYNRIDTNKGQSGSAITIPYNGYTYVAGVHRGFCPDTFLRWQKKNCGPRITSDRFKRIFNVVRQLRSTYERSMDRAGRDYRTFQVSGTSTAPCQNACMQDSKCAAWTLVAPGVQGSKARCWLKSSVPSPHASRVNTSGVKYSIEPGFDRSGGDYRGLILPSGASDQACLSNCLRDARCRAWTFVQAGVQGSQPRCWLKDSVRSAIGSGVTTSGVIGAS